MIAKVTNDYRDATMSTLRVAFLSGLVLELATHGLPTRRGRGRARLLYGDIGYETAMLVLLAHPEAYPLRAVGAQFHASMEGPLRPHVSSRSWTPRARPAAARSTATALRHARADLRSEDIRLTGVASSIQAALARLWGGGLTIAPGERIVLSGPSGAGKSTLLALLLRFTAPVAGSIAVGTATWPHLIWALAPADRLGAAAALPVQRDRGGQYRAR